MYVYKTRALCVTFDTESEGCIVHHDEQIYLGREVWLDHIVHIVSKIEYVSGILSIIVKIPQEKDIEIYSIKNFISLHFVDDRKTLKNIKWEYKDQLRVAQDRDSFTIGDMCLYSRPEDGIFQEPVAIKSITSSRDYDYYIVKFASTLYERSYRVPVAENSNNYRVFIESPDDWSEID